MIDNTSLSEQEIIVSLKMHFGIESTSIELLSIGADIHSLIYKVISSSGLSYFVKLKHDRRFQDSLAILEILLNAGIQQIIQPIKTVDGVLAQKLGEFVLIVYPFIEGQDGFSRDLTNEQWNSLGKTLRKIHDLTLPISIQKSIRYETYSPKWREQVRQLYKYIDDKPSTDEVGQKLLAFMKEKRAVIEQLVSEAEKLSHKLQEQNTEFVLCHSDIHAGNVLISDAGALYIVDWDEPIMAPKERDLMFIGAGVANVWNKPDEEALFYQGYGATNVDMTILAYYRNERIVEDIAVYGEALLLSKEGGKERETMFKHFMGMFESRGVVDVANKMDVL